MMDILCYKCDQLISVLRHLCILYILIFIRKHNLNQLETLHFLKLYSGCNFLDSLFYLHYFLLYFRSVVIFENTVKELYSQLGWEYTDLDSDGENDEEPMSCSKREINHLTN